MSRKSSGWMCRDTGALPSEKKGKEVLRLGGGEEGDSVEVISKDLWDSTILRGQDRKGVVVETKGPENETIRMRRRT